MEHKNEVTIPLMFRNRVRESPETAAQYARDPAGWFTTKTYHQLYEETRWVAAGLLDIGVKRGDLIGLISDNRQEWLASDFGILAIGAVDVPRGSDTLVQELTYILSFTKCKYCFAEGQKQAKKILSCKPELPDLKVLIIFEGPDAEILEEAEKLDITAYSYRELLDHGKNRRDKYPHEVDTEIDKGKGDELATIIFTSGTTGEPKGVMLTHHNFICQLQPFENVFDMKPGEIWLSVLPVWHVFERAVEYIILFYKNSIAYSKPIASVLMADFLQIKPHWIATVPRVWEAIMDGIKRTVKEMGRFQKFFFNFFVSFGLMYTYFKDLCFGLLPNYHGRIRALDAVIGFLPWLLLVPVRGLAWLIVFRPLRRRLGGRFRAGLTGGGTIPAKVDHFFNAVGLTLQEAYGLTETAPIVSARRYKKSRRGTIGKILISTTEFKILSESGKSLPPGHNGILHIKGEQVTSGYYLKPELTSTVLTADGWLNTGDIAMSTYDGELRLTGRAKDTIVLRSGENVEPVPLEVKLRESLFISQCMVVGQDEKYLSALIVPTQERVMSFAEETNIPIVDWELLLQQAEIIQLIANEIASLVNAKNGFKSFEHIYKFKLLPKPFIPIEELSGKGEPIRRRIVVNYAKEINKLFK